MIRHHSRSILILISAAMALCGVVNTALADGTLTHAKGGVDVGRGEPIEWKAAVVGAVLSAGDSIRTGAKGRAELDLDGSTVRLYENSLLRLPKAAGVNAPTASGSADAPASRSIFLERGRSLFDVLRRTGTAGLEVKTPEVVVSVKGTRFSVDAALQVVAVFRGKVGVRALSRAMMEEILVREGFSMARRGSGLMELHANPIKDPWSSWGRGGAFPAGLLEGAMAPPAARALEHAMRDARAHAKPAAIEQAMKRSPRLRRGVAEVVAKRAREQGKRSGRHKTVDGIVDVKNQQVTKALAVKFAQILANGGTGGGALSNFTFTFVSNPGPGMDAIVIDESNSSLSVTLTELEVINVVQGLAAFPAGVSSVLSMQGLTELQFAQALLVIFNNVN